ncbi:MAG: hypothetical protein ABJD97_07065, partial [Betaproteobacteria bacterium]
MLTRTPNPAMFKAPTMPPPWALYSWPPVFWQANLRRRPHFVHLSTRVTNAGRQRMPCSGTTVWGGFSDDGDAGLAWDWVEIAQGVIAMSDPMSLVTNLQLVTADGDVLPAMAAALHFNQFVRRLPWQQEVQRLLKTA